MRWKQVLHALWQKMPAGLRRRALFQVTARLAPRPTPDAAAEPPIIVAGFLGTASGLGEGARLCYQALSQCAQDVYGIDLSVDLGQPGPAVPFAFRDGRSIEGPGTIILHINAPYVPLALIHLGKRLVRGKKIIGYMAWELPDAPPEWRVGVPFVHQIWVPSRFTASAIASTAGEVPVRVVPHPVAARAVTPTQSCCPRQGPFTVLIVFNMASGFTRKNPLAAIEAFKQAFNNEPSCQLIVRVVNADLYPEARRCLVDAVASLANARISEADSKDACVDEFYASADVVLSLHRSEGFGLVIAEAMLRGVPVIATDWSGNMDFLTAENGLPLSYSLVAAFDPHGTYDHPSLLWAEPDVGEAAAKLKMLRDNPEIGAALANRAAVEAAAMFGVDAYKRNVMEALRLPSEL